MENFGEFVKLIPTSLKKSVCILRRSISCLFSYGLAFPMKEFVSAKL